MTHEGYTDAEPTTMRLGWRLFDSRSERKGPFLGGERLRMRSSPDKSASRSHLSFALLSSRDEMRLTGPGIIKTTEPVGSNTAGAGKMMSVPPLLCGFFCLFSDLPVRQTEWRQ